MQRQLSLGNLRGKDPVTLEVTVTEALRRPMSQLDPETLVDLMALAEAEDAPSRLKKDLAAFDERMAREITDLPDGHVWIEFMDALSNLEPERIGQRLRTLLSEVARQEHRVGHTLEAIAPLEEQWAEVPAEDFEIAGKARKVEKHEVMNSSEPLMSKRSIRIANDGKKKKRKRRSGGGAGRSSGSSAPNRRAAPKQTPMDIDKLEFLVQTCLARLSKYKENGLAEPVLLVGVRKQAEGEYPGTSGRDVQAALKHLEQTGKVKRSAGRWQVKQRW